MQDVIVSCTKCGAQNRIIRHAENVRPICGNCRSPFMWQDTESTWSKAKNTLFDLIAAVKSELIKAKPAIIGYTFLVLIIFGILAAYSLIPSKPIRSLQNGTILSSLYLSGSGKLTIDNGTDLDAEVKLVDLRYDRAIVAIYVQSKAIAAIDNIPNGSYSIVYSIGKDWDSDSSRFTKNREFLKSDEIIAFTVRERSDGQRIIAETTVWNITLHEVPFGNAGITNVSEADFEKYK